MEQLFIGAVIKIGFLAHLTHGLWRFYYCWTSCTGFGSGCHLCLEIEIVFRNLSLCISTFLSESSDDEDSGKAGINKVLQQEAVKKRHTQRLQQSMTEGSEFDEIYDKIEDRSRLLNSHGLTIRYIVLGLFLWSHSQVLVSHCQVLNA